MLGESKCKNELKCALELASEEKGVMPQKEYALFIAKQPGILKQPNGDACLQKLIR